MNTNIYIDPSRPAYKVIAPWPQGFYGPDDHLYTENEGNNMLYLDGEPNEGLEPLNEPAKKRMVEYLEKLDTLARVAAEKAGKSFIGRPRSLDGQLELATAIQRSEIGIMGVKRDTVGAQKIENTGEGIPEVGTVNPKRGRGRPKSVLAIG